MGFTPYVVTWSVFAVVVLGLALYRNIMSLHEDDNLHIAAGEEKLIPQQVAFHQVMDKIDHWGEALTAVTVAGGLVLAATYIYHVFEIRSRMP